MKTLLVLALSLGLFTLVARAEDKGAVYQVSVPDMVCEGCSSLITKRLTKLEGVTEVHVDPVRKVALVRVAYGEVPGRKALAGTIEKAGYEAGKCQLLESSFEDAKAALAKKSS